MVVLFGHYRNGTKITELHRNKILCYVGSTQNLVTEMRRRLQGAHESYFDVVETFTLLVNWM